MNKILFIANIQQGSLPTAGGAQAKNQIFLSFLQERFNKVSVYDTWKKNRIISLLVIFLKITFSPRKKIILSLSFRGIYILSKILTNLKIKRDIYFWVVGGDIADYMKNIGTEVKYYLSYFLKVIVQAKYISDELIALGLENVKVVPNFKKTDYYPIKKEKNNKTILRFVYLSRLIEEKGVGLIIDAVRQLGTKGYEVDFYGSLSTTYSKKFFEELSINNVHYKGFINLQKNENYDLLASYDVMLFPTYFPGEGFPGVLIDAFIAGLPVITTLFHANPEVVLDGKNGIIIAPKNIKQLKDAMNGFISGKYNLETMQIEALSAAKQYNVRNVLNDELFKELGIL
jgi:glycosyltransferase involved in cell wall biosynthesis